jgi:hypothetical protein
MIDYVPQLHHPVPPRHLYGQQYCDELSGSVFDSDMSVATSATLLKVNAVVRGMASSGAFGARRVPDSSQSSMQLDGGGGNGHRRPLA